MARRWQLIRVELISGRGERLDPPPGRVFILPPRATFQQLGVAIDTAFARWDFSHLREFELLDGTLVADAEMADELRNSMSGAIPRVIQLNEPVKRHIAGVGTQFSYTFDLGDDWFHLCTLEGFGDPLEVYGPDPSVPAPIWGWGTIPDQYRRRWSEDGGWDGEDNPPPPPVQIPAELDKWGRMRSAPPVVDITAVRAAAIDRNVAAMLEAVSGVDLVPGLQQVGALVLGLYRTLPPAKVDVLGNVIASLHYRAQDRGWEGDDLLSEDLLATIQGRSDAGSLRPVPVDLDMLGSVMDDSIGDERGGYLNTRTGEAIPTMMTDAAMVGEDAVVDVEEDPDWVWVPHSDSHTGWQDMADFVETVEDPDLQRRLEIAIEGRGAFRRFKDVIHQDADEATRARWFLIRDDRQLGRVREFLATHGLRPG